LPDQTPIKDLFPLCDDVARKTGFMIRSRKITAARFLLALVRSCFENAVSFRLIALNFTILTSIRISKQAIAQRMCGTCFRL